MNARQGLASFVEHFGESALACLVTMAQADVLSATLGHWAIASRTGVVAGAVASVALGVSRAQHPWVVSTFVGATTASADVLVHPGRFGPIAAEAVVTGTVAAALTYAVRRLARRFGVSQRWPHSKASREQQHLLSGSSESIGRQPDSVSAVFVEVAASGQAPNSPKPEEVGTNSREQPLA